MYSAYLGPEDSESELTFIIETLDQKSKTYKVIIEI